MRLAGDTAPCVAYLMGNHTIAERMFRHNPAAMLYAPLRTVLWQDSSSQAWFAVDQPSTQFGSFSAPASQRPATTSTPNSPSCSRISGSMFHPRSNPLICHRSSRNEPGSPPAARTGPLAAARPGRRLCPGPRPTCWDSAARRTREFDAVRLADVLGSSG